MPLSMRLAIKSGMITSMTTSPITHSGVKSAGFLYSRTLLSRRLIIFISSLYIRNFLLLLLCAYFLAQRGFELLHNAKKDLRLL